MKVTHDFTINEREIIKSALRMLADECKSNDNYAGWARAESLINLF